MMTWNSKYFYGNEISKYGLENGYVDYATLAKAFDAVLNNEIMSNTYDIGVWDMVSGFIDNSDEIEEINAEIEKLENDYDNADEIREDEKREDIKEEISQKIDILQDKIYDLENETDNREIFQYYIISDAGAEILKECNEIVFYNNVLEMYVWGVTHYGTAWSYVLTDIKNEWREDNV